MTKHLGQVGITDKGRVALLEYEIKRLKRIIIASCLINGILAGGIIFSALC